MAAILLVAGHSNRLEEEIARTLYSEYAENRQDLEGYFSHPALGVPKGLLPAARRKASGSLLDVLGRCSSRGTAASILDFWYDLVKRQTGVQHVLVVSNADKFKWYERWAMSRGLDLDDLLNTGSSSEKNSRGSLKDLEMAIRYLRKRMDAKKLSLEGGPLIVIGADTAADESLDMRAILDLYRNRNAEENASTPTDVLTYCTVTEAPKRTAGFVTVDPITKRLTDFQERSAASTSSSSAAEGPYHVATPFYLFSEPTVRRLEAYVDSIERVEQCVQSAGGTKPARRLPTIGDFVENLLKQQRQQSVESQLLAVRLPGTTQLVGHTTTSLGSYARYLGLGDDPIVPQTPVSPSSAEFPLVPTGIPSKPHHNIDADAVGVEGVCRRSYARVGLMGNPSDQLNGKSMAVTVTNFWAEVTCFASDTLHLMPHPIADPMLFGNVRDLQVMSKKEGYMGGLRLIQATVKTFAEACTSYGVSLPNKNFTLRYETNVPRQVGLAGSSCIVSACIKAMMDFFGLTNEDLPDDVVPSIVLSVETKELGIHAGLMDRVAQMFEGVVAMDFDKEHLDRTGYGIYTRVDAATAAKVLPQLHLAFAMDPSDSGKIHSDVKQRWANGDPVVLEAARTFAGFVDSSLAELEVAKAAIGTAAESEVIRTFHKKFADLMDANFKLRHDLYGDACLGWKNLRMVQLAQKHRAAAKFPGSGGAILVCCRQGETDQLALRHAYEAENFVFVPLDLYLPQ